VSPSPVLLCNPASPRKRGEAKKAKGKNNYAALTPAPIGQDTPVPPKPQ
jgi:hypothetical protein